MIADLLRLLSQWLEDRLFAWICPPEVLTWWEGDPFDKYVGQG
jgi:hypothetical protein